MKILVEPNKNELNNLDTNLSEQKAKDLSQIYTSLFSGGYGKIVLEDLAEVSGMHRSNFIIDNDRHTAFLEGKRDLFLYICWQIENNISNMKENKVINHE